MLDFLVDVTGSADRTEALIWFALSALPLGAVAILGIVKLMAA